MNIKLFKIVLLLSVTLSSSCMLDNQVQNPYYHPVVDNPAYDVPMIKVDATHKNYHTITGRFMGFSRLASADGHRVQEFSETFPIDCMSTFETGGCKYWEELKKTDIFVMPHLDTLMSDDEAWLLSTWVHENGGSLLLIIDHDQYGDNLLPLLTNLNLTIDVKITNSSSGIQPRSSGLWDVTHPIVNGRSIDESINTVRGNGGRDIKLDTQSPFTGTLEPKPKFVINRESGDGFAVVLEWGNGRIVVVGDGAPMTEQIYADWENYGTREVILEICNATISYNDCMMRLFEHKCQVDGVQNIDNCEKRTNISRVPGGLTEVDNKQFVLNILRWLSHII